MAKRTKNSILTGNDTRLRMCFYYSPYFDMNIWRRGTTLTGERTKKDPAFKGFRQSSSRLKQASPIASSLYKLVPAQMKQYCLYRTLTGEAIKMLKEGMEAVMITEILKKKYIYPLLDAPEQHSKNKTAKKHENRGRVRELEDFTAFPEFTPGDRKIRRTRRSRLFQRTKAGHSFAEYFSPTNSETLPQTSKIVSDSPSHEPQQPEEPKRRIKTTHGLLYLGRLRECKKFKMWWRPVDPSVFGPII